MIDTPQLIVLERQGTAVIRLKVLKAEIREVMGPGIQELMGTIAAQGIAPSGCWFNHFFTLSPEVWDFEIGVPVEGMVRTAGRVRASERPAMKAARTVYHGIYEGLGEAWGEFSSWIESSGCRPAEDYYECYLVGPESSDDPTEWRTELIRPLND